MSHFGAFPDGISPPMTRGRCGVRRDVPARGGARVGLFLMVQAALACAIFALWSCGGTTGHEDLPVSQTPAAAIEGGSMDATLADATPPDATLANADDDGDLDAGTFEVAIQYADRMLPDISVAAQVGATEAGYPWPTCPAFLPVIGDMIVPIGQELDEIAADPNKPDAAAPDGSPCATYPWYGTLATDECIASTASYPQEPSVLLPPCNWCAGAGAASAGMGAGESLYALCLDLYQCMMKTGCGPDPATCLCAPVDGGGLNVTGCAQSPTGPCWQQELAALQEPNTPSSIIDALGKQFNTTNRGDLGFCAGTLNQVFQVSQLEHCFPADGGN